MSAAAAASVTPPLRPVYRAPRLTEATLTIDGDLSKPAWSAAPWSATFGDIRGPDAPEDEAPPASCPTRMKMMWDDEYLYIGAEITSDFAVMADFTERNSPIYQRDSDFEVFVDADFSCHNYKELEVNALNTVWNLLLTRPYSNGGGEHSGRVAKPGDEAYYEVAKQRTAVKVVSGAIGDSEGAIWTVEIALAHDDTLARNPLALRPAIGGRWRINFSRVERKGEANWTWAAQVVWDAQRQCYLGKVNMHLPDAFGYVEFAPTADEPQPLPLGQSDEAAEKAASEAMNAARSVAMVLYYANHAHREAAGEFAASVDTLRAARLLDETVISQYVLSLAPCKDGDGFIATAAALGASASVTDERLVRASCQSE